MKYLVAFLLFIGSTAFSPFQEKQSGDTGETITWTPERKLTWPDFKKSLKGDAIEAAYSVCGISISSQAKQINDTTLQLDIHSFFSKTLSAKSTEKEILQDKVLIHEQGHFDINEWYSRILKKTLLQTSFKSVSDFYNRIQGIYNKANSDCTLKQAQYDKMTRHSINIQQQEKWNKIIADSLASYNNYANATVTLIVKH